jgi:hypothetical protein
MARVGTAGTGGTAADGFGGRHVSQPSFSLPAASGASPSQDGPPARERRRQAELALEFLLPLCHQPGRRDDQGAIG